MGLADEIVGRKDGTMDELITRISDTLGISEEKARNAVLITMDHLNRELPPHVYDEVDEVLNIPEYQVEAARELGLFKYP